MVGNKPLLYKKEYAKELAKIAKGDLQTAKALLASQNPGRLENILYMIQQAVEKSLKSVLIHREVSFPLVHDLGILIALLQPDDQPPGGFNWVALNPYASIRRYEDGPMALDRGEIVSAEKAADLVIKWTEGIINK